MFVDVQIFIKHDQTRCCFVTKECLIAKGSISHFGRSLQTNATLWNGSAIKHNIDDLIYALSLVFLGILPRDSYSRLCLARDDIWSHRVSGRAFKTREEMLNEEIQCKMKKNLIYLPPQAVLLIDLTTRWRLLKPALNTYLEFAAIWFSWARLNFLPIPSAKIRTPTFRRSRKGLLSESCDIPSVMTSSTWMEEKKKL